MVQLSRILLACAMVLALGTASFAGEYWVIRNIGARHGQVFFRIVEQKPSDPGVIVQGPFSTRAEAEKVISTRGPLPGGPDGADQD